MSKSVKTASKACTRKPSPKPSRPASAPAVKKSKPLPDRFAEVGAYGFKQVQLPILAALVTEDPLLLIGRGGTGKTFLLNSISEVLGLEHRHYNASLIAFDDLVGFPYPDNEKTCVRFLETPATVWDAESVLIDEISRCKPEHQNRLFSLVHERRVQGIALEKLRFRWAAMNPCGPDQDGGEDYAGSEPLDPALADRFAVIVTVGDWLGYKDADKKRIVDPCGEGLVANDRGELKADLERWRSEFIDRIERCPRTIIDYATTLTTVLNDTGIRVSPRRARSIARTLLAASIISGEFGESTARAVLKCALPQPAWGEHPGSTKIAAAHRLAWDSACLEGNEKWIHEFLMAGTLPGKAKKLLDSCPDPDTGSIAIEQLLANEPRERATAFTLATFPAAVAGKLPIGAEGVSDLARIAGPVMSVSGNITWQERSNQSGTVHPDKTRYYRTINALEGPRSGRARQLFYWCLVNNVVVKNPEALESELNDCVELIGAAS